MLSKRLNEKKNKYLRTVLSISTFASVLLVHPYLLYKGEWTAQNSLPLHMCELSEILAAIALLWQNQTLFEILCYWGIAGGFHSILTPELLDDGSDRWLLFNYYYEHTLIILTPVLLMTSCNMRLTRRSWFKGFVFINLCIPAIGTVNWLLKSNYMYLAERPAANNPFLIGDWPWYILVLDVVALAHFYLIWFVCTHKIRISNFFIKARETKA
jgi:hypothetical integral membrane protein (TIGR02206 family)